MRPRSNFVEQLRQRQETSKTSGTPTGGTPLEEMSGEQLRWVALEKPASEMTLEELQWVSSGEASRTLEEQAPKHKLHNFNDLKRNRRRGWK